MTKQRVKRRLPRMLKCRCGTLVYKDSLRKAHPNWFGTAYQHWIRIHKTPEGKTCSTFILGLDRK